MEPGRRRITARRLHRPDLFASAQARGRRADPLWDEYRRHAAGVTPSRRMARWRAGAVAQFMVWRHRDLFLSESSGDPRSLPTPSSARNKFCRHGGHRRRQRNFDRERQCHAAANLVKWTLSADGAVLTKYGGGLPHADLAETARLLETIRRKNLGDGLPMRRATAESSRRCCSTSRKSTPSSITAATAHTMKFLKPPASSQRTRNWPNCWSDP